MDSGNTIEYSTATISIPPLLSIFLISIVLFITFADLQISVSKKRISYLGYAGCGLELILSFISIILYNFDNPNYTNAGKIITYDITLFLLFNISTILLIIISMLTNKKYKDKIRELEKASINNLE